MLETQSIYEFLLSLQRLNFNVENRSADWGRTGQKATPTYILFAKEIAMPQTELSFDISRLHACFLNSFTSSLYMTADNIGHPTPMGSAVSKTELTLTNNDKGPASDKAETDGKLTVAQDIAGIVLSTLQQAAELAPVPYLKEAAGLAVALFDMVQSTSENKSAFKGLATDACELVYTATSVWKDREEDNDGKPLPQDLMDHLKELLKTMTDVMQFAKARASRGLFARFISHKADAGRIEGFRAQIKDALDRFGMQSHITVRDAVSRIQEQQAAILAALEAHAPSKSQLSASKEASSNPSSAPSTPHTPSFPHPTHAFTSFGNIVNNGKGTFNSVNGNYVVNNSSTNTSSKNSGNVMNISTFNSNNRYDAGGMGRANGNTRSMGVGSSPGGPPAAGRRKAEQQPGQRGRRRGMAATP